jgi:hypothetical protein
MQMRHQLGISLMSKAQITPEGNYSRPGTAEALQRYQQLRRRSLCGDGQEYDRDVGCQDRDKVLSDSRKRNINRGI